MKRGSTSLLYGDKERIITQEVFKMFIVLLYVQVKETGHLKSRYKAQNTIRKFPIEISKEHLMCCEFAKSNETSSRRCLKNKKKKLLLLIRNMGGRI